MAVVFSAPAFADAITYTLSPSAVVEFGNGDTDSMSGTFTFDAPATLESADITLAGAIDPGTYTAVVSSSSTMIEAFDTADSTYLTLDFSSDLSLGQVDPISSLLVYNAGSGGDTSLHINAAADPTEAPEPASLALLGGALGLFFFTCRLSRHGRRAPRRSIV
jgi:hypothetical protein